LLVRGEKHFAVTPVVPTLAGTNYKLKEAVSIDTTVSTHPYTVRVPL